MVSFSGGKDSMLSLYRMLKDDGYHVAGLFTTIQDTNKRTALHGVREEVLECQAKALKLPLKKIFLPENSNNKEYEAVMAKAIDGIKAEGIEAMVFGDIFLEDIRSYREDNMKQAGMEALFPLWKDDPRCIMDEFLSLGFRTVITTLDKEALPERLLGKEVDEKLLGELPESVDVCGENGEFHSIVTDGPIFSHPISLQPGKTFVQHERFLTLDFQVTGKG